MTRIAIFASGNGSNFEAIIKYFKNSTIEFICVSDNPEAYVLKRAKRLNIKSYYVKHENTLAFLRKNKFDLIVLAGYMRILPEDVLKTGTFINIHPSLLPEFKGKNAIERAFGAKVKKTGVTVHYVSKEVDSGEIIAQETVEISSDMTLEELEYQIHKTEHKLLPKTIEKLIKKYNVLLIGSGAREHALADKLLQSKLLNKLYLFHPNDGFKNLGEIIEAENYNELSEKAKEKNINLVLIGPEQPLAEGIQNIFSNAKIPCIGPDKYWIQLESSKSFAKEFMQRNNIPTANYMIIEKTEDIKNIPYEFPYVIKADGLAAGKGVYIANNKEGAQKTIKEYLNGKFKEASKKIVIEEFLKGNEISLICFWDGKTLLPLSAARDFKRLKENNKGPNTGGMGAVCPVDVDTIEIKKYLNTLKMALIKENADFTGIIYSGLIITGTGVKVLEFNMRFGDPETQVLMLNLESDLLEILIAAIHKKLNKINIKLSKKPAICVVLAARGYPDNPATGDEIKINCNQDIKIFFAGVKKKDGKLYTNGGRVLSVCAKGKNALSLVYEAVNDINFKNKIFRNDISLYT